MVEADTGRRDWGLIAVWVLSLAVVVLTFYTLVTSPITNPFGNLDQFLRLTRAALIVPLVLLLTYLLATRSRRAESSERQHALLLDLVPLGLLFADDTGTVRQARPGPGAILGRTPEALLGSPLLDLIATPSRPEFAAARAASRASARPESRELRGLRLDGSTAPIEVTVLERSIQGRWVTGLAVRDLSEREGLVRALATRAAELARSNRDLEQFAYVASHDLQEPIRMVGSFTELLQQRYGPKLDAEANEFLAYAREGAARMRELVDALLSYARLDARGQPFRPVPLETVLATALTNLRGAIEASHAEVSHGSLPTIDGDPTQLVQVFQNLIGNAIKFHGPSPPHVRVTAERVGADWQIAIADDGIGIPPEFQEKVFAIFQRLHTREEYPGSGIGLSVCRRVIERHGGRIWVESSGRPGEGTTFRMTIPVDRKSAVSGPVAAAPVPVEERALRDEARSLIAERLRDLV